MATKELTNIVIGAELAHGAFGEIFKAYDTDTDTELAIKIEKKTGIVQLKQEFSVYRIIASPTTPKVYEYGKIEYNNSYVNCMTMDLLGLSLEKLFAKLNREFSLKTIFMIGKAGISRIEHLHHKHFVHRDIKPDNFVTSLDLKEIFLIDYGLCKEYRSPTTMIHRPYKEGKNLTGTARYASLNAHAGIEQSRRDDLESLGFMLVYFIKGRLPWQGLKADTKKRKYERITAVKKETTIQELCEGCPDEIYLYMVHVRSLKYADFPDYKYLISLFENGLRKRGMEDDGRYDWIENFEKLNL